MDTETKTAPTNRQQTQSLYLEGLPRELKDPIKNMTDSVLLRKKECRLKRNITDTAVIMIYPGMEEITHELLHELLGIKWLKSITVWNMKQSECHSSFLVSQESVKPVEVSRTERDDLMIPLVMECVFYMPDPNCTRIRGTDSLLYGNPADVKHFFRDSFESGLAKNEFILRDKEGEVPLDFKKVEQETKDPICFRAMKASLMMMFVEFSEEVPYVLQCEEVKYTTVAGHQTKYHVFVIKNPSSMDARKLLFIKEKFVSYLDSIAFLTTKQDRTVNIEAVQLLVTFKEAVATNGYDQTKNVLSAKKNSRYIKATPKKNTFSPYQIS